MRNSIFPVPPLFVHCVYSRVWIDVRERDIADLDLLVGPLPKVSTLGV
jgi:hypothetical protein